MDTNTCAYLHECVCVCVCVCVFVIEGKMHMGTNNIHSNMSVLISYIVLLAPLPHTHTHTVLHVCYVCYSLSLTTEEEHVKCLVGFQDDKIRPKHHPGSLILIVVHLNCTVAGATIRHHGCLVTFLRGHKLCNRK